jgi:hypothetical protein
MHRTLTCVALVAVIALGTSLTFSQRGGTERGPGVLGVLSKGQAVNLKDSGGRYEIVVFADGPGVLPYTVIEVGSDYVVVRDIATINELHIPIYSVKAVNVVRTKGLR